MIALQSLVASSQQLGVPPGVDLPVVADLVRSFVDEASALEGWTAQRDESVAQAAFDLGFLDLLRGDEVAQSVVVQKLLTKVRPSLLHLDETDPGTAAPKHALRIRDGPPQPPGRFPAAHSDPPSTPSRPS